MWLQAVVYRIRKCQKQAQKWKETHFSLSLSPRKICSLRLWLMATTTLFGCTTETSNFLSYYYYYYISTSIRTVSLPAIAFPSSRTPEFSPISVRFWSPLRICVVDWFWLINFLRLFVPNLWRIKLLLILRFYV